MSITTRSITLATGKACTLAEPGVPFVKGYSVLVFPESQGNPTIEEQGEMLVLSLRIARELSLSRFGDSERYLLIHNGLGARRNRNFHYHIIPVSGRAQKTFLYFWLFVKNLLHGVWVATRGARRKLRGHDAA